MSLEFFSGFDQSEGMSESNFEAFKEKMARATAQIAAIQKEEKKHKKKEDELIAILLHFVKNSKNNDLVLLISKALEKNVPANFILAIIALDNEEIENSGIFSSLNADTDSKQLVFFQESKLFDLETRITLDAWLKRQIHQASENPQKLLKSSYIPDIEKKYIILSELLDLFTFVLFEYLTAKKIEQTNIQTKNVSEFFLNGILKRTKEELDNRNLIESSEGE